MLPLSPESVAFELFYRPDLHMLVVRWLRPNSFLELQTSYEQLLTLARQHYCAYWLLDARRVGPLDLEATLWLTDHFFPRAASHLAPYTLRMAVLSSPFRYSQMLTDASVAPEVARALSTAQPYEASVFLDEHAALNWLHPPHS
ncbi:hypothetical protein [Hymenobacter psychrotolerans]|uniref:SpoIIAA-like n=1 Tax=Hymenobacter psychrotolerans DSM 18569 TaxID=1121959 RepID=A0A1M7BW93_9BACT|nr:hypothetical protein [Hymenobacter psychrotolerans]SHL59282.1 hypothetical protein SAMN02746009_03030 [Hymenobacter psychrotolerans DSM 18569]